MSANRLFRTLPLLLLAACTVSTQPTGQLIMPSGLRYTLVPSGDPAAPAGIILSWTEPADSRVVGFVVYSRGSSSSAWTRRAETSSRTFHDMGVPDLQYAVASADAEGRESPPSGAVTVDPGNQMDAPQWLESITLNRGAHLSWASNARLARPSSFDYYRVYSTPYLSTAGTCDNQRWVLEGTTVSEDFLATGLPNGVRRCFGVTTISRTGHESRWSPLRDDTPRPDARSIALRVHQVDGTASGFRFYDPAGPSYGVVTSGTATGIDFRLERFADGKLYLVPMRTDVKNTVYGNAPVADLSEVDYAPPDDAYQNAAISTAPGWAYVWRMTYADGVHYAAIRVGHVGTDYILLDWAYQPAPGNRELGQRDEEVVAAR